jgi:TolA-binding protein
MLVFLHRVVDEHASGPRAPLAAFTIGRIELGRGHSDEAARYFAMARELGGNTLAEHALAREVEAWVAAGRPDKARTSAQQYLKRFPKGARAEQVRQISGVKGR